MVFCNVVEFASSIGFELVTILILIDGFLQYKNSFLYGFASEVTILILIDGFLQYNRTVVFMAHGGVTILILIDGFLQYRLRDCKFKLHNSHNPYFNRWFSAIHVTVFY